MVGSIPSNITFKVPTKTTNPDTKGNPAQEALDKFKKDQQAAADKLKDVPVGSGGKT